MAHPGIVSHVGEKGGDDPDDDQAGEDQTQGGRDAAGDALLLCPHKGGGVDGDDAGGALAHGVVVSQLRLGGPALAVHHLPLENGEHGVAAPEGTHADLGKGEEQIKIEVHLTPALPIRPTTKRPPHPTACASRPGGRA